MSTRTRVRSIRTRLPHAICSAKEDEPKATDKAPSASAGSLTCVNVARRSPLGQSPSREPRLSPPPTPTGVTEPLTLQSPTKSWPHAHHMRPEGSRGSI